MRVRVVREGVWKVYAACDDQGNSPLLDFLAELEPEQRKRIAALFNRIADRGPDTFRPEICHQIDGPIWQFRSGDVRILWFYREGHVVVCSHGFVKKRAKTPARDIAKAHDVLKSLNGDIKVVGD